MLEADREQVWDAIYDSDSWPEWWRGVTRTERLARATRTASASAAFPVARETSVHRSLSRWSRPLSSGPSGSSGDASGELAGTGFWRFYEEGGTTAVIYDWDVRTTKAWMNLAATGGQPIFRANHDWVMRNGAEGLARKLGARLLVNA